MALRKTYPGRTSEKSDVAREVASLLKTSRHFGSYAFRGAFNGHCLDTETLASLLRARVAPPLWRRRATGVACATAAPAAVSLQRLEALEAEAFVAGHGCHCPALLFEAHALEAPDCPLQPTELQLLERSNYGLAYTSKATLGPRSS